MSRVIDEEYLRRQCVERLGEVMGNIAFESVLKWPRSS
jgi:hypothetical protein